MDIRPDRTNQQTDTAPSQQPGQDDNKLQPKLGAAGMMI